MGPELTKEDRAELRRGLTKKRSSDNISYIETIVLILLDTLDKTEAWLEQTQGSVSRLVEDVGQLRVCIATLEDEKNCKIEKAKHAYETCLTLSPPKTPEDCLNYLALFLDNVYGDAGTGLDEVQQSCRKFAEEVMQLRADRDEAQKELMGLKDSLFQIKSFHYEEGEGQVIFDLSKEMAEVLCHGLASIVADAPNYVETSYEPRVCENCECVVVRVQKVTGKTPHQLRAEAESALSVAKARIAELEKEVDNYQAKDAT